MPGSWEYYGHTNRGKVESNSEKRHVLQVFSNRNPKESHLWVPNLHALDALVLEKTLLKGSKSFEDGQKGSHRCLFSNFQPEYLRLGWRLCWCLCSWRQTELRDPCICPWSKGWRHSFWTLHWRWCCRRWAQSDQRGRSASQLPVSYWQFALKQQFICFLRPFVNGIFLRFFFWYFNCKVQSN